MAPKYALAHAEKIMLTALFLLIAWISFFHVDQSITVIKYNFYYKIANLSKNYSLYHHSFKDFLLQTSAFHPGGSDAGWRTVFYLLPLFLFCDLLGGLSLKTICFFTVTSSLFMLFLFYRWMLKQWGKEAAFLGTLFFGLSAVFQEIARSGSYISYSIFMAMAWALLLFECAKNGKPVLYGMLGLFTGFIYYGHALLRSSPLIVLIQVLLQPGRKMLSIALFLMGMTIIVAPGVLVLLLHLKDYHDSLHVLFVNKENIFDWTKGNLNSFSGELFRNLTIFIKRMLGGQQHLEPVMGYVPHAGLFHPLLVLALIIGFVKTLRSCRQPSYQSLLILSSVIYVTPLLTSSMGYNDVRRALLYVIPSYCFIGLGMKEILEWMRRLPEVATKRILIFLMTGLMGWVIISEMIFVHRHILTSGRDPGLLAFADKIKGINTCGTIYYLEKQSLYILTPESDILTIALMQNGKSCYEVRGIFSPDTKLVLSDRNNFLVKNPFITDKQFNSWCDYQKFICKPIFESPLNYQLDKTLSPFRLYDASYKK